MLMRRNKLTLSSTILSELLEIITADVQVLQDYSRNYLARNKSWKMLCEEAGKIYEHELRTEQELAKDFSATNSKAPYQNPALLIDKATISIIFGITHFLNSSGYNIDNPTNFEEVSKKLKSIRIPAKKTAVLLFQQNQQKVIPIKWWIRESFGIGIAIGSLIEIADDKGIQSIDSELSLR